MKLDDKLLIMVEDSDHIYERCANRVKHEMPTEQGEYFYTMGYPFCQEFSEQQQLLEYAWVQGWPLWADGEFLDWHGQKEFIQLPRLEGEDDDSYRERILNRTQEEEGSGRAKDYERMARNAGAGSAKAIEHLRNDLSIDIFITDWEGHPASQVLCDAVRAAIEKEREALHDVEVLPATIHHVVVAARLILSSDANPEETEAKIVENLNTYIKKNEVLRYQVIANLMFVPGVEDIADYTLNGGTNNIVTPDGAVNVLDWSPLP
ncbi:baseplate J/gp47 family protein [Aneurinibacillus migulanus]|uniref:baseplate J/gp47 family protein n=1 Tax=Aneurinibacillus migulanus TaxID=47500 RepID=UPI0020A01129|nr:baseplate J/gp47 family protein [Aneurinibacillus migulanus]MCP1357509.1 baseplate J/gp47 family protein [Aneurinibacillus migulanus]